MIMDMKEQKLMDARKETSRKLGEAHCKLIKAHHKLNEAHREWIETDSNWAEAYHKLRKYRENKKAQQNRKVA